jgi:hypothetical protein
VVCAYAFFWILYNSLRNVCDQRLVDDLTMIELPGYCFDKLVISKVAMSSKSAFSIPLLLTLILLACSFTVRAQSQLPTPLPSPTISSSNDKSDSSDDKAGLGSMAEEMQAKRQIKLAEKTYKENVERAREVAELGAQLYETVEEGKAFGEKESKKLERLEKLAKKIRTEAGGSEEDDVLNNPPGKLDAALSRLAEVSDSLFKAVQKTPRQVISAAVIQQANVVLQLSKVTRRLFH